MGEGRQGGPRATLALGRCAFGSRPPVTRCGARRGGAGRGGAYSQRADAFSSNAVGAADAARLRLSGFSRLCCFRSVGARPVVWSGPLRGSRLNGGGRGPWGLPASGPREGTVSLACAFDFCFMFVESFPPAALVLF